MDWLDRLTFREIEQINEKHKRVSKQMYLMVEFPEVFFKGTKFDIVYFETGGDEAIQCLVKPPKATFFDSTLSMVIFIQDVDLHIKLPWSLGGGRVPHRYKSLFSTRCGDI